MAPRLKDIAIAAGIDSGSVSHILNNRTKAFKMKPETRERVLRIAREMGYCRDEFAASVASRHGNVLAFITADMGDVSYTGRIQNGVFDAASAHGFALSIYHLEEDNHDEIRRKLVGWRSAGVVFHIAALETAEDIMSMLDLSSIPYSTVNLSNPSGMSVTTDDAQGVFSMLEHFRKQGASKPLFLTNRDVRQNVPEYISNRNRGFLNGLAEFFPGVEPAIFEIGETGRKDEIEFFKHILKRISTEGFDAVACVSDYLAIQFQQIAVAAGVRIPEELLVSGFGNLFPPQMTIPSLTTTDQNFEEMGRQAAELVFSAIKNKKPEASGKILPVKILENESTNRKGK